MQLNSFISVYCLCVSHGASEDSIEKTASEEFRKKRVLDVKTKMFINTSHNHNDHEFEFLDN